MSVFQPTSTDEWVRDQTKKTNLNDRRPRPSRQTSGTVAQRNVMFPPPANLAQRVALANRQVRWFNTEQGWWESYYTTNGEAGLVPRGLAAGVPAGWYPMPGNGPRRRLVGTGSQGHSSGTGFTLWSTTAAGAFNQGWGTSQIAHVSANGSLRAPFAGDYVVDYRLGLQAGSGTGVFGVYHGPAGGGGTGWVLLDPVALMPSYGTNFSGEYHTALLANLELSIGTNTGTLSVGGVGMNTAMLELRYVSPTFAP